MTDMEAKSSVKINVQLAYYGPGRIEMLAEEESGEGGAMSYGSMTDAVNSLATLMYSIELENGWDDVTE